MAMFGGNWIENDEDYNRDYGGFVFGSDKKSLSDYTYKEKLDSIPISVIEKYIREKKLNKLKK